jgi:hypothetical protein
MKQNLKPAMPPPDAERIKQPTKRQSEKLKAYYKAYKCAWRDGSKGWGCLQSYQHMAKNNPKFDYAYARKVTRWLRFVKRKLKLKLA